jgi:hypothetical protein
VDLGRRAWQEERTTDRRAIRSSPYGAIRRGKCGSRSKDGRREGDHDPDLEAMGSESHGRRGGRSCRSTARGADHAGRVLSAPAAL